MKRTLSYKSKSNGLINCLKKNPIVINDLIQDYLGLRYCHNCEKTSKCKDWLIPSPLYIKRNKHFCPNCYDICKNCYDKRICVYLKINLIVNCENSEEFKLCKDCFDEKLKLK